MKPGRALGVLVKVWASWECLGMVQGMLGRVKVGSFRW